MCPGNLSALANSARFRPSAGWLFNPSSGRPVVRLKASNISNISEAKSCVAEPVYSSVHQLEQLAFYTEGCAAMRPGACIWSLELRPLESRPLESRPDKRGHNLQVGCPTCAAVANPRSGVGFSVQPFKKASIAAVRASSAVGQPWAAAQAEPQPQPQPELS